jgi:hypothetical protein
MRFAKSLLVALAVMGGLKGCGTGSEDGPVPVGTVSITITDARPVLPEHVVGCIVTIDEVRVRRAAGQWEALTMARVPYTIDLLQVTDGKTAELVPPAALPAGDYTQVRLSVSSGTLRLDSGPGTHDVAMVIPPENLRTDSAFEFDVAAESSLDVTLDFDLSRSIAAEGLPQDPVFTLRPALHLVPTDEAATIQGTVANSRFAGPYVEITVSDSTGHPYTRLQVDKDTTAGATEYVIPWVVPGETYEVSVNADPAHDAVPDAHETVETEPGEVYDVNF